jgi:two-component system, chemotaxis family, sensor kinase CheA
MDELLEQFLIEGRDLIAQAHGDLHVLDGSCDDRAALDSLFRTIHTLKGSVALFDMAPAEKLLHAAETTLDRVRRGAAKPGTQILGVLLGVVDQIDRWIDAMESSGALPSTAPRAAEKLFNDLGQGPASAETEEEPGTAPAWIAPLLARPEFAGIAQDQIATVFRYTPDRDCFFRGEDPLATIVAVPELLGVAVLPNGEWPALDTIEPFHCFSRFEGVSAAGLEAVRAAFRLVPDQIELATVHKIEASPAAFANDADASIAAVTTTLRVDAAKLDQLIDRSGELGVAARTLTPLIARARTLDPALADDLRNAQAEIDRATNNIQQAVAQVRLVSLEPVLRRLPRLARDAAASLGKNIRFELTGETTEVDKQVADGLFEPLLHLVRNAVDHGIEPEAARKAAGKPSEGCVILSVRIDGENVRATLSDDGGGIDPQKIRDAALAKGLIDEGRAAAIDDAQAVDLIFLPGFSTASEVTEVSGRGVGMDAVRNTIERLNGTITIDSRLGQGTVVHVRLPVNAITARLLIVTAGDERVGVRLDQIVETVRIESAAIQPVGHGNACVLRDRTVPVLDLGERLGLASATGTHARLLITDGGEGRVALRVGGFGERVDAMVRGNSGLLARLPAIAGTTMLGGGEVLLVLDLPELIV